MALPTHDVNLQFNTIFQALARNRVSFSKILYLVAGGTNSLNGERTQEYLSVDEAETAQTAGYISAGTLAGITTAFAQQNVNGAIESILVGRVDETVTSAATKAFKAFGGAGLGDGFDSVLEAHTAGTAGNLIAIQLVGDSAGAVAITSSTLGTVTIVKISYQPGVSTVTNVETAIAALAGAAELIDTKTGGTGATVLDADAGEMLPTLLAGGAAAVTAETYGTALAACIADDASFYGVCIDSRLADDIVAANAYIYSQGGSTTGKRMILVAQDEDTDWLVSGGPAGFSTLIDEDLGRRCVLAWHDSATEDMDLAYAANRLNADLDTQAPGWNYAEIVEVDEYSSLTAAQRALAVANHANLMLAFGTTSDTVVNPGETLEGRTVEEIVTGDWAVTRMRERIADMTVTRAADLLRVPMSAEGQSLCLAEIEAVLQLGENIGHFVRGQTSAVAVTISTADRTARRLRFTVRWQSAISFNIFSETIYASIDPISAVAA